MPVAEGRVLVVDDGVVEVVVAVVVGCALAVGAVIGHLGVASWAARETGREGNRGRKPGVKETDEGNRRWKPGGNRTERRKPMLDR